MKKQKQTQNRTYIKVPLKNIFNVPRVITIHCYDMAPDYNFGKGESHDFWELYYVDRGNIFCPHGDVVTPLKQGDILFIPPNEHHSLNCDGVHEASVFIVTFDCRSSAMKYFADRVSKVRGELASLMKRLIEESTNNFAVSRYPLRSLPDAPIGGQQLIRIYLEEFLIRLMRSEEHKCSEGSVFTSRETLENTLAKELRDYLDANVYRRVTLEEITARFHFGKSHLCDLFKRAWGDTIVGYHSKLKIAEAKRLLREESVTVSEISARLSFESPEYFSRTFKKITGMSPRAFQRTLINSSKLYLEKK